MGPLDSTSGRSKGARALYCFTIQRKSGVLLTGWRLGCLQSDESGREEIYVHPYPSRGAKRMVSTDGGSFPAWSQDGKELFYRNGNKLMVVLISHILNSPWDNPRCFLKELISRNHQV